MTTADWNSLGEVAQLEVAQEAVYDGLCEVICPPERGADHDCGCEVEPDGHCYHGCPSILLTMGVI